MGPRMSTDNAGGAIIVWVDERGGTPDIYAQRVLAGGAARWTENGVAVCEEGGDQLEPGCAADGWGGVIVAWQDARNGSDYDIYVQRVDSSGVNLRTGGMPLSMELGHQKRPAVCSAGAGEAIVSWEDSREELVTGYDVYAGWVPAALASFAIRSVTDVGHDNGGQVRLRFGPHDEDVLGSATPILRYDVLRRIEPGYATSVIPTRHPGTGPGLISSLVRAAAGWDYLLSVPAQCETEYNVVVPRWLTRVRPGSTTPCSAFARRRNARHLL